MAHISVAAEPVLNIAQVDEVIETDPVIASFINKYFQTFLENDQALKNMIEKIKKSTSNENGEMLTKMKQIVDSLNVATDDDIDAIINGTYVDSDDQLVIITEKEVAEIVDQTFNKGEK